MLYKVLPTEFGGTRTRPNGTEFHDTIRANASSDADALTAAKSSSTAVDIVIIGLDLIDQQQQPNGSLIRPFFGVFVSNTYKYISYIYQPFYFLMKFLVFLFSLTIKNYIFFIPSFHFFSLYPIMHLLNNILQYICNQNQPTGDLINSRSLLKLRQTTNFLNF